MPRVYLFKNAKEKAEAIKAGTYVRTERARPKAAIAQRKINGHGHSKPSAFAKAQAAKVDETGKA